MNYLKYFQLPIDQTIQKRISCRTYQDKLLESGHKEQLKKFWSNLSPGLWGEDIQFHLVEYGSDDVRGRKLAGYGLFKNIRSFMIGVINNTDSYQVSFGYAMEQVVLKSTELGLGTCWLGYFDPYVIKDIELDAKHAIPAICSIGYPAQRSTLKEKIARAVIRASRRREWNSLFYENDFESPLTGGAAGVYTEALELLRLAPSAGNTQPWRVIREKDSTRFHFFKKIVNSTYEKKKLHDIDLGIAMCHFELGCEKNKITGQWKRTGYSPVKIPPGTHYVISWV